MTDQEAEETVDIGDDDASEQAAERVAEPAPEWLIDFRRSGFPKGFYRSGDGYGIVFAERSADTLVVSFDNLSSARDDAIDRTPWGYGFVAKNGWSQLGVMTFAPDWFRNGELLDYLQNLADSRFLKRFRTVVMTGTSMGGYAACAFASLAPCCTVIAFSPQSTLKKELVPWEKRFSSGRRADWSGPFADGAQESLAAGKVLLLYDPHFAEDVAHADRFTGDNVVRLKARYSGHKSALFLRRAGLLSTIVRETVEGRMSEQRFYEIYRAGRALPWYVNAVAGRLAETNRHRLLPRMSRAVSKLGFEQISRSVVARAVEAGVMEAPPPPQRQAPGPINRPNQPASPARPAQAQPSGGARPHRSSPSKPPPPSRSPRKRSICI
ncbi:hypothetical protein PE067_16955 [Paracoccus sp. DMF-8]|uniref:hypothetical protein n=1 Tax=Paracoccus sp. DMF-8 TaxID=3019445 RepID=UPI0023E42A3D|nr:hypothetical protein [Paracoccus sp. DMF-8]MDF3607678.1 hypothetical protein [Paracoccus sp. DMF-8]